VAAFAMDCCTTAYGCVLWKEFIARHGDWFLQFQEYSFETPFVATGLAGHQLVRQGTIV
jgi:hypothetical protein